MKKLLALSAFILLLIACGTDSNPKNNEANEDDTEAVNSTENKKRFIGRARNNGF